MTTLRQALRVGWVVAGLSVCLVYLYGCATKQENENNKPTIEAQTPIPKRTMPPIPPEIASLSANQLCEKIQDITVIPNRVLEETDPIFESLLRKGDEAIPCLLNRITDSKKIPDPRYSVPIWQNYAVGDSAVFILVDILRSDDREREKLLIEMLPPKFEDEWKTNGVYAYFNYVSEPRNRKELQSWWKTWLKENGK